MKTKKLIFILDALKANESGVFLSDLIVKNCQLITVLPPFSFEPDAAYLTGYSPEETDSGAHYCYDPDGSVFKESENFLRVLLESPLLAKKIGKKILIKYLKYKGFDISEIEGHLGMIPFNLLKEFSPSSNYNLFNSNTTYKYKTIFNLLKQKNVKYGYIGVPFSDGRLEYIKNKVSDKFLLGNEVIFIYIGDLDSVGHKYGGNSKEYKLKLFEIISYINEINQFYELRKINTQLLIFGDHGMVNVDRTFNIQNILRKLPLMVGKDYIYFFDSTLARFWFKTNKAKETIINAIPNNEYGQWISEDDKKDYKINYSHNKFGDAIWWASGGTLILPNFWQGRKKINGMHGYRDDVSDNHTAIIGNFKHKFLKNQITMMDVHTILLDFLEMN